MRENYNIHAGPRPDSWLVCCPFRCHHEWSHEWQHGGLCPCRRSFGCVLSLDQIFRKQCTDWQYTTLIYLINLLRKLVLGLGLDSELHYFSIFTENTKNEHLSSANVTDVNLVLKERTHMRLCINMLIFTHNLGNWLITLWLCVSLPLTLQSWHLTCWLWTFVLYYLFMCLLLCRMAARRPVIQTVIYKNNKI